MEKSIKEWLTIPIEGQTEPLFKNFADFFKQTVDLPGHPFSAKTENQANKLTNSFRRRWYHLQHRESPDIKVQWALREVLKKKLDNNPNQHDIIEKIMKSLPYGEKNLSYENEINNENFIQELEKNEKSSIQSLVPADKNESSFSESHNKISDREELLNALQISQTLEIVCEQNFVANFFSHIENMDILLPLWNSIILKSNPKIRFYVPWDQAKDIWIILRQELGRFLLHQVKPLINKETVSPLNIPWEEYLAVDEINGFFRMEKIAKNVKVYHKLLDELLRKRSKRENESVSRHTVILALQIPKEFSQTNFIFEPDSINPDSGKTRIFRLKYTPNNLFVREKNDFEVKTWKLYEKPAYLQIFEDKALLKKLTKVVGFGEILDVLSPIERVSLYSSPLIQ